MANVVQVQAIPSQNRRIAGLVFRVPNLYGFPICLKQLSKFLSFKRFSSFLQLVFILNASCFVLPVSAAADAYLVYADIFNNRIMRVGLDGSNPTVLASNLKNPLSLSVDEQNGKIYYSTYQGGHQAIRRVNLDGSGGDALVGNLTGFSGLVHMNLNPATGRIYYYHGGMNPRTIKHFDLSNNATGTTFDG